MQPRFILILWLLLVLMGCSNQKNHHDSGKESESTGNSQAAAKEAAVKEAELNKLCETLGKDQCASHPMRETGLRQCAYMAKHPELLLNWSLTLSPYLPKDQTSACVSAHLRAMGVTDIDYQRADLNFKASYYQVEKLLNKAVIDTMVYEPLTHPCVDMPPGDSCEANAFCMSRKGAKLNLQGRCYTVGEFCMEYADICGQAFTYAQDPAGNYWRSGSTCIPSNFNTQFDYSQIPGQVDMSDAFDWPLCSP